MYNKDESIYSRIKDPPDVLASKEAMKDRRMSLRPRFPPQYSTAPYELTQTINRVLATYKAEFARTGNRLNAYRAAILTYRKTAPHARPGWNEARAVEIVQHHLIQLKKLAQYKGRWI